MPRVRFPFCPLSFLYFELDPRPFFPVQSCRSLLQRESPPSSIEQCLRRLSILFSLFHVPPVCTVPSSAWLLFLQTQNSPIFLIHVRHWRMVSLRFFCAVCLDTGVGSDPLPERSSSPFIDTSISTAECGPLPSVPSRTIQPMLTWP